MKKKSKVQQEKSELIKTIRKDTAKLNRRVESLRKNKFVGTADEILKKSGSVTKTKNISKVSTGNLSRMSLKQLRRTSAVQKQLLEKKYSTTGQREIQKERIKTLKSRYGFDDKAIRRFMDVIKNKDVMNIINELTESSRFSSDQLLDLTEKFTSSDIIKAMDGLSKLSKYELNAIGKGYGGNLINDYLTGDESLSTLIKSGKYSGSIKFSN